MLSIIMLSVVKLKEIMLTVVILSIIMRSVLKLKEIMLTVVILSIIMLSVVVPLQVAPLELALFAFLANIRLS